MKKNLLALMCMAFIITGVSACGNNNGRKAKEASGDTEATEQAASTKGAASDALTGTQWTATYPLDLGEGKMGKGEYILSFSKDGKTQFITNDYDENGKLDTTSSFKCAGTYAKVAGEENEWTIRYEDYEDEIGHVYLSEDGEELRVNWYMVNEVLTIAK